MRRLRLSKQTVRFSAIGLAALAVVIVVPLWQTWSLRKNVEDYRSKLSGSQAQTSTDLKELAALEKAQLDTENALRTSLVQALGGIAVLSGVYFAYRNLEVVEQNLRATQRNVEIAEEKQVTERKTAEANLKLAEAKQVTDRFSKAVEMLSSSSLHTRLGGIYALERIARDSDKDYWQVMEVLTAFVREESPWPPKPKQAESDGTTVEVVEAQVPESVEAPQPEEALPVELSGVAEGETSQSAEPQPLLSEVAQQRQEHEAFFAALPPLRTDIQAIMAVIGRRKARPDEGEWRTQRLELQRTDLRKLQAYEANLTGVALSEAHLEGAALSDAYLKRANLSGAHLERANLRGANLEGAYLFGANLKYARMQSTDLSQVEGLTQEQVNSARTNYRTILPLDLQLRKLRPPTPTPTPSTPPPAPAAPSTATAEPSSQSTPEQSAESNETQA